MHICVFRVGRNQSQYVGAFHDWSPKCVNSVFKRTLIPPVMVRMSRMLRRAVFHFCHKLLLLYPPILEPDSDLPLRKVGRGRNLLPLVLRDEFVGGVFFLQLLQLHLCVRYPLLPSSTKRGTFLLVGNHICRERARLETCCHHFALLSVTKMDRQCSKRHVYFIL